MNAKTHAAELRDAVAKFNQRLIHSAQAPLFFFRGAWSDGNSDGDYRDRDLKLAQAERLAQKGRD